MDLKWLDDLFEECESKEELSELVKEYIEENYILAEEEGEKVTKAEYDATVEKYEGIIKEMKENAEKEKRDKMIEEEIVKNGGRNVKAVLAVVEEEDLIKDEQGNVIGIDLSTVKEREPYLFKEKEEKVEGTGVTLKGREKKRDFKFAESARRAAGLK